MTNNKASSVIRFSRVYIHVQIFKYIHVQIFLKTEIFLSVLKKNPNRFVRPQKNGGNSYNSERLRACALD